VKRPRLKTPTLEWSRRRGSLLLLLLGLAAIGAAVAIVLGRAPGPLPSITITAGSLATTRSAMARTLVGALAARGLHARLVETSTAVEALEKVDAGMIDFALVADVSSTTGLEHVREVAPLYVEALHLLVKTELADATSRSLAALRGHTVDIGPVEAANAKLSLAVLAFAGITPADGPDGKGYVARHLDRDELVTLGERGDPAVLPDAVTHLGTVPSKIAIDLVRDGGYRLVALPFAEAFRLNSLIAEDGGKDDLGGVQRQHVVDTVIPAFTYEIDPPIPAEPLHTLGARLLLTANDAVAPAVVELVLDTLFGSRIARVAYPPLDHSVFAMAPHLERHAGTLAYVRRDQPFMTQDTVNSLSNYVSVMGALAGGTLFLWQWVRQRAQASRDRMFGSYLLRTADIERRVSSLELAATLELEPLAVLQREVLELKSDALQRFAAGDLGSQTVLTDLLMPLNAIRDHIGELILHVRESLEQQAEAEGRSATALWKDAIKPDEPT